MTSQNNDSINNNTRFSTGMLPSPLQQGGSASSISRGINKEELFQLLDLMKSKCIRINLNSVRVDYVRAVLNCVANTDNYFIEELIIYNGQLRTELCCCLANAIESNHHLKILRLREVSVDTIGISWVFDAIASSSSSSLTTNASASASTRSSSTGCNLKELYIELKDYNITKQSTSMIHMLKTNKSLKMLHIIGSEISYDGGNAIANVLEKHNTTLEDIILQATNLSPGTGMTFRRVLQHNKTLKSLYLLGNPQLSFEDISNIFYGLEYNKTLKVLVFQECKIKDAKTLSILARLLSTNKTSLTKLCFWYNDIGPDEVSILAKTLTTNTTLKEIRFKMNPLTDIGLEYFIEPLKNNTTLQLLDLEMTNITEKSIESLCQLLMKDNVTLTNIELYGNDIDRTCESKKQLNYYLSLNRSLRRIWFLSPPKSTTTTSTTITKTKTANDTSFFPLELWPLALETISKKPYLLFEVLRHNPHLVSNSNITIIPTTTTATTNGTNTGK